MRRTLTGLLLAALVPFPTAAIAGQGASTTTPIPIISYIGQPEVIIHTKRI